MNIVRTIFPTVVAACLIACGNSRQQEMDKFRQKVRTQFLEDKLSQAQQQLARTDSLLQVAEQDDSLTIQERLYRDSLQLASDVQGAKIRYIHRKQKEL